MILWSVIFGIGFLAVDAPKPPTDDKRAPEVKPADELEKLREQIAQDMQAAEKKLKDSDAGRDTQQLQKQVLENLDKLLERAKNPPPPSESPMSGSAQKDPQSGGQSQSQPSSAGSSRARKAGGRTATTATGARSAAPPAWLDGTDRRARSQRKPTTRSPDDDAHWSGRIARRCRQRYLGESARHVAARIRPLLPRAVHAAVSRFVAAILLALGGNRAPTARPEAVTRLFGEFPERASRRRFLVSAAAALGSLRCARRRRPQSQ